MMNYLIIDNFLSVDKCLDLINISESIGYKEADISYSTGSVMNKEYRDNYRILYSDNNLREFIENGISGYIDTKISVDNIEYLFSKVSNNFRF